MKYGERIKNWKLHPSMRGHFSFELYKAMSQDKRIWLLVGDLGYSVFDNHRDDFPDRFINTGAAEQSLLDIACGLAMSGKIPFCYSITPFLIYRPFETIRTYINHEKLNVKLIGSGRDKDYAHDGFSHDATDVKYTLEHMRNIKQYYPEEKEFIPKIIENMVASEQPMFLSLKR